MVNLLTNLLTPIFGPMGVAQADLISYLEKCIGYIYVILAALVVMIVVLIAAVKVKKGQKLLVRGTSVVAFIAVVALVANLVCYGPLHTNVEPILNSSSLSLSEETVNNSFNLVKKLGEEGMVLAKNDGLLPLSNDVKNLNVFGWASTNPVYGGTGSGGSSTASNVGILQSLKDAGYTTNETLSKLYTDYRTERPDVNMSTQDWTLPEPTMDAYTDAVMSEATSFSDVALIVIARGGGENADLPDDMNAVIKGTYSNASQISSVESYAAYIAGSYTNNGSYDDFEPGEHYLELSVTEENLVEKVCSAFDDVIVVINANNAMELGWVDEYPSIKSVILAPGTGVSGFAALGEIINGSVNPSGRTVDTYVKDLLNTPSSNNFGHFQYTNLSDMVEANIAADPAFQGAFTFVNYVEGIYVGYKFYETANDEGMAGFNYDDHVQYPFGYGLSYTTFEQKIESFKDNGDSITFDVNVTNTGSVAGKEVVEVYFTPPYTNGGIEKASVNLIQYEKTETLEPGASEKVSFTIPKEDFACYDSSGAGRYVLEAGEYEVSIRANSHEVLDKASFTVDSDIDYSSGRASDGVPVTNQFQDYSRGDFVQLSRKDAFANYSEATAAPAESAHSLSAENRAILETYMYATYDSASHDNASDTMPTLEANNGLKLADLTGKSYDDADWDKLLDQLSIGDMFTMVNLGGWQTAAIESVGKVGTSDCDGPAGLNNLITQAQGTSFGTEVQMAQTWNKKLAYELGQVMSQEYVDFNNYGWYGPAMNTHRNAFAGRNYEYYSEDGVLAGLFAAQQVNGAAEKGVYAYIKHFALNDQERNRNAILLTWADEQAIREIYLKPFELVVKNYNGTSLAVMSAYSIIGPVPTCTNSHLLKTVLRDEWGFVGMVETDYNGSYGYQNTDNCVRNGNDLMLGFIHNGSNQISNYSPTLVNALRQACKNILYTVGNSGYYTNVDQNTGGLSNMDKLFLGVDIGVGVVLVAAEAFFIYTLLKKKKSA